MSREQLLKNIELVIKASYILYGLQDFKFHPHYKKHLDNRTTPQLRNQYLLQLDLLRIQVG